MLISRCGALHELTRQSKFALYILTMIGNIQWYLRTSQKNVLPAKDFAEVAFIFPCLQLQKYFL